MGSLFINGIKTDATITKSALYNHYFGFYETIYLLNPLEHTITNNQVRIVYNTTLKLYDKGK